MIEWLRFRWQLRQMARGIDLVVKGADLLDRYESSAQAVRLNGRYMLVEHRYVREQ